MQQVRARLIAAPYVGGSTLFLAGPPGSGKTSVAVERLRFLLAAGVPAEQMLVLVPQRTLAHPYYEALRSADLPPGGAVDVATIGGLARRTLDLFWPLVAAQAGVADPDRRPRFLTIETAQYHLDRILEPFAASGAFDGITIGRSRLISQILDNLNKAAAVGFPVAEIADRLKNAWAGESARMRVYDQVQAVALAFREYCLAESLLDWSLQIQVFQQQLMPLPQFRRYLLSGYRHLIADNVEEDIPAAHDLVREWLSLCESALLVYDTDGGYRVFLGADPQGALALADSCSTKVAVAESYVAAPEVAALGEQLAARVAPSAFAQRTSTPAPRTDPRKALVLPPDGIRFHPQMLDWVAAEVSRLVREEAVPAGEIAILAPFLSDSLRFSLSDKLARYGLAARTHRPSRELREEPAAQCLLTLARLAHPAWRRPPPPADVANALTQAIADMDPVRARLLTDIVYRVNEGKPALNAFHQVIPGTQKRISYLLGGRYDELQRWLQDYVDHTPHPGPAEKLADFVSQLFGEVLSQPGFGFHHDLDAGSITANLIESIQKFVQAVQAPLHPETGEEGTVRDLGLEYVDMVARGIVAAQYVSSWQMRPHHALLLLPAYTFLMMNQPVAIQFWLDAGSTAWAERIYQPLTHPHVLSKSWPEGQKWSDADEVRVRDEALARLVLGLTRRCRQRIFLAYSELSEQGHEQRGPLLQATESLLRHWERTRS